MSLRAVTERAQALQEEALTLFEHAISVSLHAAAVQPACMAAAQMCMFVLERSAGRSTRSRLADLRLAERRLSGMEWLIADRGWDLPPHCHFKLLGARRALYLAEPVLSRGDELFQDRIENAWKSGDAGLRTSWE